MLPIKVSAFRPASALQNSPLWQRQRKEIMEAERLRLTIRRKRTS